MTDIYPTPLTSALTALLESEPDPGGVQTEEITHTTDGVEFGGFIARPADDGSLRPAVLLFPDWSGIGNHTRVRATMLARLGYIALAGDIYGGGQSFPPDQSSAQAGRFYGDPELFRARVNANLDYLRTVPGVDPDRIAALGYCFGGSGAIELARSGAEIAGIVSFHGGLGTGSPAVAGGIRTPLLVLTGAADPVVPDDQLIGFENELRNADAPDWQVVSYSGALHAFTMPDADAPEQGAQFQARANARSWRAMKDFFGEVFA